MTTNAERLEKAAIDAHAAGVGWSRFWTEHAHAIQAAEPDPVRRCRLVGRLMALLVSGDTEGQRPVGDVDDAPWERDDAIDVPSPHDGETRARLLWPADRPVDLRGEEMKTPPPVAGPFPAPPLLRVKGTNKQWR